MAQTNSDINQLFDVFPEQQQQTDEAGNKKRKFNENMAVSESLSSEQRKKIKINLNENQAMQDNNKQQPQSEGYDNAMQELELLQQIYNDKKEQGRIQEGQNQSEFQHNRQADDQENMISEQNEEENKNQQPYNQQQHEEDDDQIDQEFQIENIDNIQNSYRNSSNVDFVDIKCEREDYENCHHEVFIPENFQRKEKDKRKAAKEYQFKLDPFQRKSIECLEQNESVLVAAHTSAGKTAVAEYAIAMSFRDKQKVIYTSPIKALSNQKYRELQREFKDVGLVTGDVSLNQNSACLVMTTEILRSMLYKGSEVTQEVAWVIFDEVHYMRDKERGVNWEETIILLNPNVRYVFLSATIPNAAEFAEWICKIKKQPCHVVYTDFRPVPLQHYLFPSGGEGIHLVVDEKGQFRDNNFSKALASLGESVELINSDKKKRKKPIEGSDLFKIVQLIKNKEFYPTIIFSFSKKEVEGYAMAMQKLELTTLDEQDKIQEVFTKAIACLSEEDQNLPQIQSMLPILKKGIGIHHGGLLPIIKEVTELLFQEGWIKILFSTETFSMGVNMPARSVVFTSVRKFDGENVRWILGSEYIQMSGRAGRRGKDDKGLTILMVDEKMDTEVAKNMLKGQSDPLNSSFHLQYNMLLNALRIEDTDPEYIIRRSFHQFQKDKAVPEMLAKYKELKLKKDHLDLSHEKELKELYTLEQNIKHYNDIIRKIAIVPKYVCPFLSIGRMIRIVHKNVDWGWGLSINFALKRDRVINDKKLKKNNKNEELSKEPIVTVDVMLHIKPRKKNQQPQPALLTEEGEMEVIPMLIECISEISSIKINLPFDLISPYQKNLIKETLLEVHKKFSNGIPVLNPVKEMKIENNEELLRAYDKKEELNKQYKSMSRDLGDPQTLNILKQKFEEKIKYIQSLKLLKTQIEDAQQMVLSDDLKCMKRVLRRLDFIARDDIVQLKGQVACEISACDEILVTELLFKGIFNEMDPSAIAAILSSLMHDEQGKENQQPIKNEILKAAFQQMYEEAKKIFIIYQESKFQIEEKEYLGTLKPQLADSVYAWCKGATFIEVCKMSEVYEGTIIRCMRRLDELLKQLQNAAKIIGNELLENKFLEASNQIKRGIVFAASLYL